MADTHSHTEALPIRFDGVGLQLNGHWLLRDIKLTLSPGLPSAIMGPNGAGKSLLLRLCNGLLTPTVGRIRYGAVGSGHCARRAQAMVFQRPVLLRRSVWSNIRYALGLRGVPWRERNALATEALALAGLEALARQPARTLSGGQQQRLAIARAWAMRPEVLLMDEPTASLDPGSTREIEKLVRVFAERGVKVVLVTHDLGQARRLADEVIFLCRGELLEQSPATQFFERPQTREAAAFLCGDLLW